MAKLMMSQSDLKRLIRERRRRGGGRGDWHDEVWDGVYFMSPDPDNVHQSIRTSFCCCVHEAILGVDAQIFAGCNVSDRPEKWTKNYRIPDVAVFLPGNPAQDRGTHWLGGPDFAVEIVSPGDRSRKKFRFYAAVGVRELLFVDRRPWSLELYRRDGEDWTKVGRVEPDDPASLASLVLPLSFRLLDGLPHPSIEARHAEAPRRWII